jgi:hypothetical protein
VIRGMLTRTLHRSRSTYAEYNCYALPEAFTETFGGRVRPCLLRFALPMSAYT